jgi:hypothetical protein
MRAKLITCPMGIEQRFQLGTVVALSSQSL